MGATKSKGDFCVKNKKRGRVSTGFEPRRSVRPRRRIGADPGSDWTWVLGNHKVETGGEVVCFVWVLVSGDPRSVALPPWPHRHGHWPLADPSGYSEYTLLQAGSRCHRAVNVKIAFAWAFDRHH